MNEDIREQIRHISYANRGYISTKDVVGNGINRFYINQLEKLGFISKVKNGLYKWEEYDFQYNYELVDVFKIVPKGVLCLTSALAYHDLITYNPWQYEVAIERTKKIALPDYPPIKLVYFSSKQLEIGITETDIDGHHVRIYDPEKTICDCVRYRNKIGIDIVKEGINEYLKRKEKDFNKLMKYAEVCRIQKILKEYLEMLT
jgi:predicted transcriptional regulator of viral defense system